MERLDLGVIDSWNLEVFGPLNLERLEASGEAKSRPGVGEDEAWMERGGREKGSARGSE